MTDTNSSAISTEGLTGHYGDVRALVDLDLEIRCGEVLFRTTTPRAPAESVGLYARHEEPSSSSSVIDQLLRS